MNGDKDNNNYSVHTFELITQLTYYDYRFISNSLEDYRRRNHLLYTKKGDTKEYLFFYSIGINKLSLLKTKLDGGHIYRLRFIFNARRMVGIQTYPHSRIIPTRLIHNIPDALLNILVKMKSYGIYLPNIDIDSTNLSRMDYCINIKFDSVELAQKYLLLLKRGRYPGRTKLYTYYDSTGHRQKSSGHSFTLFNGSKIFEIYIKNEELINRKTPIIEIDASGVIRFEYRMLGAAIRRIKEKKNYQSTCDFIENCSNDSKEYIVDFLSKCYGTGDFYTLNEARQKIQNSSIFNKESILDFIEHVAEARSIQKAMINMGIKHKWYNYIVELNNIGISPITIPQNFNIAYLKNPIKLLNENPFVD